VGPKIRHSQHHCSVCQQSTWFQQRGQDFDEKFVFEGVHSKEVDRRISKRGVNKLLKKLRDTAQLTGGQTAADRAVKRK